MLKDIKSYYDKASINILNKKYDTLSTKEKLIVKAAMYPLTYNQGSMSFTEYFKQNGINYV